MSSSADSGPIQGTKDLINTAVAAVTGSATTSSPTAETPPDVSKVVSPGDPEAKAKLQRQLSNRPDRSELVEKNILKDPKIAPGLYAAQNELARAQLEDKLANALQSRPSPEELVKEGILQKDEVPDA